MRARIVAFVATVGLVLLGLGCGQEDSSPNTANPPDPAAPLEAATARDNAAGGDAPLDASVDRPLPAASSPSESPRGASVTPDLPAAGPARANSVAATGLPPETWGVQMIGDSKVGHTHFWAEPVEQDGERLWRLRSEMQLELQRFGQTVSQIMRYESVETPSGQLRSCRVEVHGAGDSKVITGQREGDQLVLQVTAQGSTEETRIDWKPHFGGFFAVELSLLRDPLKPGESRTVSMLAPLFNTVGTVELQAADFEATDIPGGSLRLLRVVSSTQMGGSQLPNSRIEETLWLDDQGNKLKSRFSLGPGIELVSYRTSREDALRAGGPMEFDLGDASVVRVDQPIPEPHTHQRIVYRCRLKSGEIDNIFLSEGSQQVRRIDDSTVEVTVQAVRPGTPAELATPGAAPGDAERTANSLVQSDDPAVQEMAQQVAPDEKDAWALAVALEKYVHGTIERKNFSQAFASAAEVCRSREGDCTEHAVLLAALCRARGIPARVAIGLVYYPQARGFAYHMWNEVWIEDRWIPLDSTLGRGGIGAAHLKLAQSSLRGASAYSTFLPVFEVLGNLDLEVVSID